jgi:hypothetical protein
LLEELAEAIKDFKTESEKIPETMKLSQQKQKGLEIQPIPGFVYKTLRADDKKKVIINITSHEILEKPAVKKKLDKDGNEVEGINIPISVGIGREETDKSGIPCLVYDLIVNPEVIQEVDEDKTGKYRDFICQLGLQSLEQKYQQSLEKKYKLPKLKYFGDLENIPKQVIQDRKSAPKIEEVKKSVGKSIPKSSSSSSAIPSFQEIEKELVVSPYWYNYRQNEENDEGSVFDVAKLLLSSETATRQLLLKVKKSLENHNHDDNNSNSSSPSSEFMRIPYKDHELKEYIDPVQIPLSQRKPNKTDSQTIGFFMEIEFQSYLTLEIIKKQLTLSISPFKFSFKLPSYKSFLGYFPLAIDPIHSFYYLTEVEGSISQKKLLIFSLIDFQEYQLSADPGSKTWLVSQALSSEEDRVEANPYRHSSSSSSSSSRVPVKKQHERAGAVSNELAEDKFHIPMPSNVDPYTGLKYDYEVEEEEEEEGRGTDTTSKEAIEEMDLPEDRFHKKDAGSQFILSQREQTKKEKWDRHEQ